MAKICMFGGTFNPIHNGHIEMATKAYNEYKLDKVLFVPTGNSYLKSDVLEAEKRMEMAVLAASDKDYFEVDDIEVKKDGASYTFETLSALKERYINDELYFLIGDDSLRYIDKWKNPEIIFQCAKILVASRISGYTNSCDDSWVHDEPIDDVIKALKKKYKADISRYRFFNEISSTFIRNKISSGDINSIKALVPNKVLDYILENGLYK